ncbi:hypothetical protein ACWKSR_12745, partial [Campylobacter fetus subsp. venerealis]
LNVNNSEIFAEEVPEVLIQKPNITIVYRTEELQTWWGELDVAWQEILRKKFTLSEDPSPEELHAMTGKAALSFERTPIGD